MPIKDGAIYYGGHFRAGPFGDAADTYVTVGMDPVKCTG